MFPTTVSTQQNVFGFYVIIIAGGNERDSMLAHDKWSGLDHRSRNEPTTKYLRSVTTVQFYEFKATRLFWDIIIPQNTYASTDVSTDRRLLFFNAQQINVKQYYHQL